MITCNNPGDCTCTDFSKKFCKWYGTEKKKKSPGLKRGGRIKPMSPKRKEESKEYTVVAKAFLSRHPYCEVRIEGICKGFSFDVHHKARRGKNYLDVTKFMAVCRPCHDYIETHAKESREKGWII